MTAPVLDIATVIKEAAEAAIPTPVASSPTSKSTNSTNSTTSRSAEPVATDLEEEPTDSTDPTDATDTTDESSDATDSDTAASDSTDDASDPDESAALPDLPDGYVAVPTVKDGLAAEFTLKDAEGEVEVPDLVVEYKANGKIRQDRLDQVVKLAQWGVYNQEREEKVKAAESAIGERDQLAKLIVEREAQMERLLTDPDFLYSVQQAYEEENSPEKRVQRAEQQVQSIQVQHQMEQIEQQGTQFYKSEIEPALVIIKKALPSVTDEELADKVMMAMQAHADIAPNGERYVPPSRYDAIRKYIVEDLAIWAQAQHVRRTIPATPSKAERELERVRVEAQKAKRMVGQTTRPVGQAGKEPAPAASAKPTNIDDAVNSALSAVMSSFNAR